MSATTASVPATSASPKAAAAPVPSEGAAAAAASAPTPAPAKTEGASSTDIPVSTDVNVDALNANDDAQAPSAPIDPNANLTIRALVSTKEAGVIIGKGGAHVAELRDKTGVKAGVSKVVQGVHDRVLSVSGTLEGVSQAYSLIAQTILDNPVSVGAAPAPGTPGADGTAPAASTTTALRLLISHTLMGTVIGRQGLKIKHIQDMSGTRMVASKEMLPSSTERIVEVQGNAESLRVAVGEIGKCLLEDWERGQGTILYTPGQADGAGVLAAGGVGGLQLQGAGVGGGRRSAGGPGGVAALAPGIAAMGIAPGAQGLVAGSGVAGPMRRGPPGGANGVNGATVGGAIQGTARGSQAEAAAAAGAVVTPGGGLVAGGAAAANAAPIVDTANNQRTQNISIPSDMVGCIIGKGGSKITEIRRLSGSRISIAKVPHDETGERMFTIQGTPEANEKALFLLYNQLESEKERRTNIVAQEAAAAAAAAASSGANPTQGEESATNATPAATAEAPKTEA